MSTRPSRASGEPRASVAPAADPIADVEQPTEPAVTEQPHRGAPSAAAKEKFREALERKNAAAHRSETGVRHEGAVHGPETAGPGKRVFRRKSG